MDNTLFEIEVKRFCWWIHVRLLIPFLFQELSFLLVCNLILLPEVLFIFNTIFVILLNHINAGLSVPKRSVVCQKALLQGKMKVKVQFIQDSLTFIFHVLGALIPIHDRDSSSRGRSLIVIQGRT